MKAWVVYYEDDWCSLVHAKTRGKACAYIMNKIDPGEGFICFHALRLPGLDDKPITYENAADIGFFYQDEFNNENRITPKESFINDCACKTCIQ